MVIIHGGIDGFLHTFSDDHAEIPHRSEPEPDCMTDLPPGWVETTIGDLLLRIEAGKSFRCEARIARPGEWGVIKVSAMTWGKFREEENKAVGAGIVIDAANEIKAGDILLSRANTESYVGASVLVGECRPRLLLSDKSLRLVPSPLVDRRWLVYLLGSPRIRKEISRRATGTKDSMRNISQGSLKEIGVPLPPVAEQRRIVAALEDHLSCLNAADVYLQTARTRLERFGESVLADAAAGRLSVEAVPAQKSDAIRKEILELRASLYPPGTKRGRPYSVPPTDSAAISFPGRWASMSLEEVTHPVRTISYGILKPGPNLSGGVPYVRVINMRGDQIALDDLHRTSREIDQKYTRSKLQENDILLSIRGTYGRIALVPRELEGANITQDTARLAFLKFVDPQFAAIYLRSPQAQRHLRRVARGVAVKGVNIGDLREMPFPVPPLAEQRAIVGRVEALLQEQTVGMKSVSEGSARSRLLRRALLAEAFAGRLVEQDPSDEPASVLLERIRAERAARGPVRRTRRGKGEKAPQKETLL